METCSLVLTFKSVEEILWCDHSNETSLAVLLHGTICLYSLSYDPYGPASLFFAKSLMKAPYEGHTHLRERGQKKQYSPITKAYGLTC